MTEKEKCAAGMLYDANYDENLLNQGLEYAWSITVGSDVWIGAGVQVFPGVTGHYK